MGGIRRDAGGDTRSDAHDETLPGDSDPGADLEQTDLHVGVTLGGRYHLEAELGRGGEGVVFRALDRVANEPVAIKLLGRSRKSDEGLERLRRELKLARRVTHPGVVRIHDLIEFAGQLALSMELVDGITLSTKLEGGSPFPAAEWVSLAADLVRALAAAHRAGVVHRDLKPANILLRASNGRAVVTDFGVSRMGSSPTPQKSGDSGELALTSDGAIVGTPLYMAPEQLQAKSDVGPPADLYAFGVILYEAATGTRPHLGQTIGELRQAREARIPPLSSQRPDLPAELCRLIDHCLDPDPAARPRDGTELRARFDAALPRRQKRRWWIAAVAALSLAGIVGWRLTVRPPRPSPIIERLTNEEESLERFSLSPDGKQLAIGSTRGGSWDLWLLDLASGGWRQLTHDPAVDQAPQFTDDGKALLFFSIREQRGLYRLSLDDPKPEFIVEMEWFASAAAGKVAYLRTMHDLAIIDLAARSSKDVVHLDGSEDLGDVTLSADGRRLIYNTIASQDRGREPVRTFLLDLESGKQRTIEKASGVVAFVGEDQLVVSERKRKSWNLWRMFLDGRAAEPVTTGAGPDTDPVLGPDHKLYYLQTATATQLFRRPPGGAWERVTHDRLSYSVIGVDGAGRILVSREDVLTSKGMLEWLPGGEPLGLGPVSAAALHGEHMITETIAGDRNLLTRYQSGKPAGELAIRASCRGPTVSADGTGVAFANVEEGLVLWQGERRQLSKEAGCSARFSPNRSDRLAWVRRLPGDGGELMVVDLPSGNARPVTRLMTRRTAFAWEPSGEAMVFHDGARGRLVRVDLASGARSDVADRPTSWLFDLIAAADGTLYASAQLDRDALMVVENFSE